MKVYFFNLSIIESNLARHGTDTFLSLLTKDGFLSIGIYQENKRGLK